MRCCKIALFSSVFALACGSTDDAKQPGSEDPGSNEPGSEGPKNEAKNEFPEELLPEELASDLELMMPQKGDIVMFSDIVRDIEPGADVTYCTFTDAILDEPFLYNVGLGSQTIGGHHAVLQYTTTPAEPGTRKCNQEEMDGQILMGGTGGDSVGSAITVPPEVAVEIPAGAQFVINHHYINYTTEPIDGQAMMIARAHDADELILAGQLIMGNMGFELSPLQETSSSTEVVFGDDMAFFMTAGHMHEWGTYVSVEVERAGGDTDMAVDTLWTPELAAGTPDVNMFPLDEPFVIHEGDTVRLTCEWENTTDAMIQFPREMCIFIGYTVDGKNRYAFNGLWINPDTFDPDSIDTSEFGL